MGTQAQRIEHFSAEMRPQNRSETQGEGENCGEPVQWTATEYLVSSLGFKMKLDVSGNDVIVPRCAVYLDEPLNSARHQT